MDAQLRRLVGQRVTITGEAEPENVVDIRHSSPPLQPRRAEPVGTSGREPQVSTGETARIEVSDVQVRSARATGERCLEAR